MKNNDLSNVTTPRILVVAEGGVIYQVAPGARRRNSFRKEWNLHHTVLDRLMWLWHSKDVRVEIVTYLGDDFAERLASWLDDEMVPVARVWSTDPERLSRAIAYMPDLAVVYDPDSERWLTYGAKGIWWHDPNQLGNW